MDRQKKVKLITPLFPNNPNVHLGKKQLFSPQKGAVFS
jgi:hypothetical protein